MAEKNLHDRRHNPHRPPPGAHWFFWTAIALITAGVAAVSGITAYRLLSYGREVVVARVTGTRLTEAAESLRQAGLRYKITERRHDDNLPAGFVLEQDRRPGDEVKEKTRIGLVISMGPSSRLTPDFEGLGLDESRILAARDGIEILRVSHTRHARVRAGHVIAQNPAPGTRGRPDVALLVSSGDYEAAVTVPNLIGQRRAPAEAVLSESGLRIRVTGRGGVIMWQRPEAGVEVPPGAEVEVGLSGGGVETEGYPWEGLRERTGGLDLPR